MDWRQEIACKNCGTEALVPNDAIEDWECSECGQKLIWSIHPDQHVPNRFSPLQLFSSAVLGTLLTALAVVSLLDQRATLPILVGRHLIIGHFNGPYLVFPVFAMLLAAIGLISIIVDQFDQRQNEYRYKRLRFCCFLSGYILMGMSIFFSNRVA